MSEQVRVDERLIASVDVPRDFSAFYDARHDVVYRALALTLRDPDLAAEAADEAMLRAFERWPTVSGMANPSGWVYRVGLNWARSRYRRIRREVLGHNTGASAAALPSADPDLDRALASLSYDHRAVVVLRLHLDWSTDEVAAALGVPAGTVKSRLSRALEQLRKELS